MRHPPLVVIIMAMCLSLHAGSARGGGGISVDAGLTPPEGRYILRAQTRYMTRSSGMSDMTMTKFPFVLAYGVRSDLTLLAKQIVTHRSITMGGNKKNETGFDDFFALVKYKAYRRNTRHHTLGIAPTLGLEMPTGNDAFSSGTYNLAGGLYFSWRSGPWAADLNMAYRWNGLAGGSNSVLIAGDVSSLYTAFSYQYSIGGSAYSSLFPVVELSYEYAETSRLDGDIVHNTGGSVLYASPGIKYASPSLILEALVRIPASWDLNGTQPDPAFLVLAGIGLLF